MNLDKCGHGLTWEEPCAGCEAVWMRDVSLPRLMRTFQQQKELVEKAPAVASDPRMMVAMLENMQALCVQISALLPTPTTPTGGESDE